MPRETAVPEYMPIADELKRFNAERERMLGGQPISPDRRLPIEYTGVGGDVAPPYRDR
jgi:hypothetical protein